MCADGHAAAVRRELDRVGQQVEDDLFEPQLVRLDLADVVGDLDLDGDAVCGGALADHRQRVFECAGNREDARIERHLARFDLGQVQDLVEQLQQMAAGVPDVAQVFLLPLVDLAEHALQQHFREADDRVQRCAQFMRHARQELRLVVARDLELAALRLELAVQPGVDDREGGLAGEGFEQLDHVGRVVAGAASADHQHADHLVADDHRHGEHRSPAVLKDGVQELVALHDGQVGDLERLVGECGLTDRSTSCRW